MLECSRVIEGDISKVDNLHIGSAGQRATDDIQRWQAAAWENVTFDEITDLR